MKLNRTGAPLSTPDPIKKHYKYSIYSDKYFGFAVFIYLVLTVLIKITL